MEKKKRPVVTKLDNQYIEEKTLENIRNKKRKKMIKRRTTFILVVGLIFVSLLVAPLVRNYSQLQESKVDLAAAKETLAAQEMDQEELNYYINLLENEEYVLKLARSEYYLTKDDEIVFSFPEDKTPDHDDVTDKKETEQNVEEDINE
ncbi:FtsB family cell division protein [Marinilactibacillus kalidii]|uniref:FtsB family cell division protein n=1 Tax=Marinilactibacillus kalidii TaxID=2820274 RepID=UPI001ABE6D72|nr:septum formation initiator family protein [Marinilactibacillus kalidii]